MTKCPIAVMSFNRPHYLGQVLDSLIAQESLNGRELILFQDNAVSPYSQTRFADDADIAACIDIFRAKCPTGTVLLAEDNLGIARNFLRAEEFVFSKLGSDVCYFFEDDMILSPHYLTMMDKLYAFAQGAPQIGYFAAYGTLTLPLKKQRAHAHSIRRLGYNWAFGVTRQHWIDLREWLEPYYQFCADRDYRNRRIRDIELHYRGRGIPLVGTNQDVMKRLGTYQLGRVGINTFACYARYIGAEGVHSTQDTYERDGFDRTEIYPEVVELDRPTDASLAALHAAETEWRRQRYNSRVQQAGSVKSGA